MRIKKNTPARIIIEVADGSISAVYATATNVSCTVINWDELKLGDQPPPYPVRPLESASDDLKWVLPILSEKGAC